MLQTAGSVKRILVVDKQRAETSRLARELPEDRYAVTLARDVDEAITLMDDRQFDAALIEVDLPRPVSFGLLRRFRELHPTTKVIMMTEWGDDDLWVDALSEGACDLVAKPVLRRDLEKRI